VRDEDQLSGVRVAVVTRDGTAAREPLPFDDGLGRERGGIRRRHTKRELGLLFVQRETLDERESLAIVRSSS
jgi:hypothetical protein